MPYSTISDLLFEMSAIDLAKLTGDPTGIVIDNARILYAQVTADGVIDGYLKNHYPVPLTTPVDPIIKKISVDFTIANLFDFAYLLTSVPYTVVVIRANALKLLKDIQLGLVSLVLPPHAEPLAAQVLSNKSFERRMFGDETLDRFAD